MDHGRSMCLLWDNQTKRQTKDQHVDIRAGL